MGMRHESKCKSVRYFWVHATVFTEINNNERHYIDLYRDFVVCGSEVKKDEFCSKANESFRHKVVVKRDLVQQQETRKGGN